MTKPSPMMPANNPRIMVRDGSALFMMLVINVVQTGIIPIAITMKPEAA
ncbi:hypothetical protein FHT85_005857 [Rhizobium sp. BK312]|nr:hypothetical protein [Rhizobium sp. BK312]